MDAIYLNVKENITEEEINLLKKELVKSSKVVTEELIAFGICYDHKRSTSATAHALVRRTWVEDHSSHISEESLCFHIQDTPRTNWYFGYAKTRLRAGVSCGGGCIELPEDCTNEQAQAYLDAKIYKESQPTYYWCYRDSFAYAQYETIPTSEVDRYRREIDEGKRSGWITDDYVSVMNYYCD